MDKEDLMIGDLISIPLYADSENNIYYKVESLGDYCTINKGNYTLVSYDIIEPVEITPEILEKNGFKKDAFTNLSPDFYFYDDTCSISINLKSTCDKMKGIWAENKKNKHTITLGEERHAFQKFPLYVHELQHALKLCEIKKEIEL